VNAKPVSAAKIRTEAVLRNVVAPVTPAFVPSTVFLLPMLCAMVLPSNAPCRVLFAPLFPLARRVFVRVLSR